MDMGTCFSGELAELYIGAHLTNPCKLVVTVSCKPTQINQREVEATGMFPGQTVSRQSWLDRTVSRNVRLSLTWHLRLHLRWGFFRQVTVDLLTQFSKSDSVRLLDRSGRPWFGPVPLDLEHAVRVVGSVDGCHPWVPQDLRWHPSPNEGRTFWQTKSLCGIAHDKGESSCSRLHHFVLQSVAEGSQSGALAMALAVFASAGSAGDAVRVRDQFVPLEAPGSRNLLAGR